jgi:hypothetical protein
LRFCQPFPGLLSKQGIVNFLVLLPIRCYSLIPVSNFPGRIKHALRPFGQQIKIDFAYFIGGAVIIFVDAVKIKNDRDSVLRKIPVVRPFVQITRMVLVIIGVIKI